MAVHACKHTHADTPIQSAPDVALSVAPTYAHILQGHRNTHIRCTVKILQLQVSHTCTHNQINKFVAKKYTCTHTARSHNLFLNRCTVKILQVSHTHNQINKFVAEEIYMYTCCKVTQTLAVPQSSCQRHTRMYAHTHPQISTRFVAESEYICTHCKWLSTWVNTELQYYTY